MEISTGNQVNTVVGSGSTPSVCVKFLRVADGRRLAQSLCSFEPEQMMVMPRGMAEIFPKRRQGRKIDLGGGPDPGLLVALLGQCGDASLIA
jgi:hypothetical protein